MSTLAERRQAETEKYRRVYRDYPNYTNREARIALTREWILSHLHDCREPDETFLDVGSGLGEVLEMAFDTALVVTGCDVVMPDQIGHWVQEQTDIIDGAHDLPYKGASFDLVTCTDVMEHLLEEDVPAALSEIARVARGPVLLTICHMHDRPGKWGDQPLHITVHPRAWWEDKIREHMGAEPRALYTDRVGDRGTWYEVMT